MRLKLLERYKHVKVKQSQNTEFSSVGKNNMGKSTALEALRIYASLGSPHLLEKLLDSHDETVDILPTEGILPVENFFTGMCFPKS